MLVEPERRNTAAAVAFAAQRIAAEDPDAVMLVLPADHHIPDVRAFAASVRTAAHAAHEASVLVTLGITPARPETGYGYIEQGAAAGAEHPELFRVRRFVEKPDAARARRFLRRGGYFWNAGIFVWSAREILAEIARYMPELDAALAPLGGARPPARAAVAAAYRRAPSAPIDTGVMERSRRVWTLPVTWHWSDVGTWESLATELGVGAGPIALAGGFRAGIRRSKGQSGVGQAGKASGAARCRRTCSRGYGRCAAGGPAGSQQRRP